MSCCAQAGGGRSKTAKISAPPALVSATGMNPHVISYGAKAKLKTTAQLDERTCADRYGTLGMRDGGEGEGGILSAEVESKGR